MSIDGGTSWTNVLAQTSDQRGPRQTTIDISGLAAGEADVKARFYNYNAAFAWWWQVDNILLGSAGCLAGTGGLVVGTVEDVSTGTLLAGATVENIGGGSTTDEGLHAVVDRGLAALHPLRGGGSAGLRGFAGELRGRFGQHSGGAQLGGTSGLPAALGQPHGGSDGSQRPCEPGRDRPAGDHDHQHRRGASASFELLEINAPLAQQPDPRVRAGVPPPRSAGAAAAGRQGAGPHGEERSGSAGSASQGSAGSACGGVGGRCHLELPHGHHLRVGRGDGSVLAHLADEPRGGGRRRSRLPVQPGRVADGQHDRPVGHRRVGRRRRPWI